MIFLEKNFEKLPFKLKNFELLRRGMYHDLDKFSDDLIHDYLKITEYYKNKREGLPNKNINEEALYNCCETHSNSSLHHLKYHIKNNSNPSNIDICEMCCDWAANSDRRNEKDYTKYFLEVLVNENEFCKNRKDDFLKILNLLMEKTKNENK